jgi:Holliday junction resolvasome RuvABC DNA-binding subunit
VEDVISALVNLGYQRQAAARVVGQAARGRGGAPTFEALVKEALKRLAEGARG